MPFLTLTVNGFTALHTRLQGMQTALPGTLAKAIEASCVQIAADLAAAAPSGSSSGTPMEGDAPGHLKESFRGQLTESTETTAIGTVTTSQPNKLRLVRSGTGLYGPRGTRITPKTKRALMWPEAAHPVRSVKGTKPNDFVTPILDTANEVVVGTVTSALAALNAI